MPDRRNGGPGEAESLMRILTFSRFGLLMVGIALLGLAGSGCSGSTSGPGHKTLVLTKQQQSDLSVAGSELERQIYADGRVTFDEYESAIFASVRCFEDAGVQITEYPSRDGGALKIGPKLTDRGEYQYIPQFPQSFESGQAQEILKRCDQSLVGTIRPLWLDFVAPSAADVQDARDAIAKCLRSEGVEVSQHPGQDELYRIAFPPNGIPGTGKVDLPAHYAECAKGPAEHLGIPSFIG